MRQTGTFIAVEGCDGVGKSTLVAKLADELRASGFAVVTTKEPGGTAVGERVRAIFLDPDITDMDPMTELMLISAARAQHVRERIRPALEAGKVVVCDRYVASTVAYQGYARRLGMGTADEVSVRATGGLMPHLTLILDCSPDVAAQRRGIRGKGSDRMESEGDSFMARVRDGFLAQVAKHSDTYRVINAAKSEAAVLSDALDEVKAVLGMDATTGV